MKWIFCLSLLVAPTASAEVLVEFFELGPSVSERMHWWLKNELIPPAKELEKKAGDMSEKALCLNIGQVLDRYGLIRTLHSESAMKRYSDDITDLNDVQDSLVAFCEEDNGTVEQARESVGTLLRKLKRLKDRLEN